MSYPKPPAHLDADCRDYVNGDVNLEDVEGATWGDVTCDHCRHEAMRMF